MNIVRGDKKVVNMKKTPMDNVFRDITSISELLLTGGEVFITINELEHLCDLMESGSLSINKISIITNATVLGSRTLQVLKRFSLISN